MKKITTSVLALSLFLGTTNGIVNANELTQNSIEEHTKISQEDINELTTFLNNYNVDKKVQMNLIKKLNDGEIWDSLKKDQKAIHSYEIQTNGITEKVEQYQDGSIVVTSVDYESAEEITPFAVSPGTVTGGSGYKNFKKAKVYYNAGIANAHFYADFTIVFGGNDYISRVYDHKVSAVGGSANDIQLKLTRSKETLDNKASAKLSFNYINFNNTGSISCWLKLTVGKDKYTETHSY